MNKEIEQCIFSTVKYKLMHLYQLSTELIARQLDELLKSMFIRETIRITALLSDENNMHFKDLKYNR